MNAKLTFFVRSKKTPSVQNLRSLTRSSLKENKKKLMQQRSKTAPYKKGEELNARKSLHEIKNFLFFSLLSLDHNILLSFLSLCACPVDSKVWKSMQKI